MTVMLSVHLILSRIQDASDKVLKSDLEFLQQALVKNPDHWKGVELAFYTAVRDVLRHETNIRIGRALLAVPWTPDEERAGVRLISPR